MTDEQRPPRAGVAPEATEPASVPRQRVRRRRLLKGAVVTGAGVVAASGVYVRPSVRPLQVPTVHAFSF